MNRNSSATKTIIVLLVVLAVAAAAVYLVDKRNQQRAIEQSPAASIFKNSSSTANFTDFAGREANLDQYLGQTLIVNSWASWAPSSASELRLLTNVAETYDNQGVIVIGINRAESQTTAERYLDSLGLRDSVRLIVDADDRYYDAIGGYTMPETVVYDTAGNVVLHHRGPITRGELEIAIGQTLSVDK